MIKVGTRVTLKMGEETQGDHSLFALLNRIGGECIKVFTPRGVVKPDILVAFDEEHLPEIQEASNEYHRCKHHQLSYVGMKKDLEMPDDKRFFLLVFGDEYEPA